MERKKLGDSYDLVKRLWNDLLFHWSPLYADPQFIPEDLREDYRRVTGIPVLQGDHHPKVFSVFIDPNKGICNPASADQSTDEDHVTLDYIVQRLEDTGAKCAITFDMSFSRAEHREQAMYDKMDRLRNNDVCGFYYDTHAAFLFATADEIALTELRNILIHAGLPPSRLISLRQDA